MSFLLRTSFIRSAPRTTSLNVAARRFASGDYGSGAVKKDTPNEAVHHEHPGPAPPSAAQQGNEKKSGHAESQKGDSNDAQKSGSSSSSGKSTSDGPQPKLSPNGPAGGQESEDVAKHNREMDQRADKAATKLGSDDHGKDHQDKVSKGFWQGQGGVDKDP